MSGFDYSNKKYILAIESSCDDTAAAVLQADKVLSNVVASQEIHETYGGVVPELASRSHQSQIIPVVDAALKKAGISKNELNAIAFTRGPGLLGSLIVGTSFAKGLALSLDIPLIEVHHLHAHLLSTLLTNPKPDFPFLCLTVSGGHTEINLVKSPLEFEKLGYTLDDAAGEAFDKVGKMLGLPYPAGPYIDKHAKPGNRKFEFPKPKVPDLNFSFSGLKTAVRYFLRDHVKEDQEFIQLNLNDICASVQSTIIDILLDKLKLAASQTRVSTIAIAGGVSANSELRSRVLSHVQSHGWMVHIPAMEFCTDNAAMIGLVGYFKLKAGIFTDQSISPSAKLSW